jgi:zinc transporter ZupT
VLLVIIAGAAFASTFLGGLLALKLRDKLHLILGFSAGAVIGVAFFDLLPEGIDFGGKFHSPSVILSCTAFGFLSYLVLDRVLLFHGDSAAADSAAGDPAAGDPAPRGMLAAGVLCIHSLLDGIAIGFAFQTSRAVGIVVAIAVLTHDFSDGINTMNIVLKNRGARSQALSWLIIDALAPVLGIASTYFFRAPATAFGTILALFAGFFLYIGASDLIPESYHAHPKFLTTAMTLAGAAVLYLAIALIG